MGRMMEGSCHCCHHLSCVADYDLCFLQAAVQRFETLAGRSAMVRAYSYHLIQSDCLVNSLYVSACSFNGSIILCQGHKLYSWQLL